MFVEIYNYIPTSLFYASNCFSVTCLTYFVPYCQASIYVNKIEFFSCCSDYTLSITRSTQEKILFVGTIIILKYYMLQRKSNKEIFRKVRPNFSLEAWAKMLKMRLCTAPRVISLQPLSSGKWLLVRNLDRSWWHRHTSLKKPSKNMHFLQWSSFLYVKVICTKIQIIHHYGFLMYVSTFHVFNLHFSLSSYSFFSYI